MTSLNDYISIRLLDVDAGVSNDNSISKQDNIKLSKMCLSLASNLRQ